MNAEGVLNFGLYPESFTVTVTFDPEKTTAQEIMEALSEAGYPVSGEPKCFDSQI